MNCLLSIFKTFLPHQLFFLLVEAYVEDSHQLPTFLHSLRTQTFHHSTTVRLTKVSSLLINFHQFLEFLFLLTHYKKDTIIYRILMIMDYGISSQICMLHLDILNSFFDVEIVWLTLNLALLLFIFFNVVAQIVSNSIVVYPISKIMEVLFILMFTRTIHH